MQPVLIDVHMHQAIDVEPLGHLAERHGRPLRGAVLPGMDPARIDDLHAGHLVLNAPGHAHRDHQLQIGVLVHRGHVALNEDGDGLVFEAFILGKDLDLL